MLLFDPIQRPKSILYGFKNACRLKHIIRGHSYIFQLQFSSYKVFKCTVAQSSRGFITPAKNKNNTLQTQAWHPATLPMAKIHKMRHGDIPERHPSGAILSLSAFHPSKNPFYIWWRLLANQESRPTQQESVHMYRTNPPKDTFNMYNLLKF